MKVLTLIWVWFSFPNSETVRAVTLAFAALTNISLEIFMPNLISLTCSNLSCQQIDMSCQLTNWDVVIAFPIYAQLGAILKPDSGRMVCKTYVFISSTLSSYKN